VVQQYPYARLYNLYLDPRETHSYMVRKLVYIEIIMRALARHRGTFQKWPNRPPQVTARGR
jgi:arylsulfatase